MPGLASVLEVLRQHNTFLIACHVCPDGDAIGSLLAMRLALLALGKEVYAVSPDEVPDQYAFLPGAGRIIGPGDVSGPPPEVIIALDASDLERTGDVRSLIENCGCKTVNIDHHATNDGFGDYNYVVPGAAATGELVYQVIRDLGVDITPDIATCILTALMTDTGSFRYCNTTSISLSIAASLVEHGASPSRIAEHVFETRSRGSIKLLGKVLDGLQLSPGGDIAWGEITHDLLTGFGVTEAETEGFINYARMIKGVRVALLFREGNDGKIHVGFRSRDPIDVSEIAKQFGGGGHARAAGCTIDGSVARARECILPAVENAIRQAKEATSPEGVTQCLYHSLMESCQSSNPLE